MAVLEVPNDWNLCIIKQATVTPIVFSEALTLGFPESLGLLEPIKVQTTLILWSPFWVLDPC